MCVCVYLLIYSLNIHNDFTKEESQNKVRITLWVAGVQCVSYHHCLPTSTLAESWSQEPGPAIKLKYSDVRLWNFSY